MPYPSCFTLPFSHWQVKKFFKEYYGMTVEKVWEYKGTRYGHVSLYNVYDIDGKLLYERVTLDTLRRVLTIEGFTISDGKQ